MKRITYIICAILISAGFISNGEIFMLYLDEFQNVNYYHASFGLPAPNKDIDDDMKKDILMAGEKYDIDFFLLDSSINEDSSKSINIYGTKKALSAIRKNGIDTKRYNSLFIGSADVKLKTFDTIKNISQYEGIYFTDGKEKLEDMRSFKADLAKYSGSFPRPPINPNEIWMNLLSVWFIVCVFIVLLFLYDMLYMKKENALRITLGEDTSYIFRKNATTDASVILLLIILIPIILSSITNSYFKLQNLWPCFILIVLLSILINASVFRINFKKDLSNSKTGGGLLATNYFIKSVSLALTVLVLSAALIELRLAINLYSQKAFFESQKAYSYYEQGYFVGYNTNTDVENEEDMTTEEYVEYSSQNANDSIDEENAMYADFYKRFYKTSLRYVDLSPDYISTYPTILINGNALAKLEEEYPDMKSVFKEASKTDYCIIYPSKVSAVSPEYEEAISELQMFPDASGKIKDIRYKENIDVVAILRAGDDYTVKTKMYRNPILLLHNKPTYRDGGWEDYSTMYDIPRAEYEQFLHEYKLEKQITRKINVLKDYENTWKTLIRGIKLTVILAILLLLLEMGLVVFILRMEYRRNAVEMALKKVNGYTLIERNSTLIAMTIIGSLVSTMLAILISGQIESGNIFYILFIGLSLLFLEIIFLMYNAKKTEAKSIPRILKGEI